MFVQPSSMEDSINRLGLAVQSTIRLKKLPVEKSLSLTLLLNFLCIIQSNFSGSNTLGTMTISSRQGLLEPTRVDYSARSGGFIGISF